MKRKPKTAKHRPLPFTQAEFQKGSLTNLMRLYRQLWQSIEGLNRLTDYREPLNMLIDHHMVAPLERALMACIEAIKATKPDDPHETEIRAALLYQHAMRFDLPNDERRRILLEGMLAIPTGLKTEVHRFPKHVGGGELTTVRDGRRIVWRGFRRDEERRAARKVKGRTGAAKA
jgi:hypothetical protein